MTPPIAIVLSNALDDATRQRRGITTDSPAASRKVFMLCEALRLAGVRPYVLSLGRGRANGRVAFFRGCARRVRGVPVVYAPFTHVRLLSELLSLFGPILAVWRLARRRRKAIIYYNRMTAYVPTLAVATALGYRNVLDLEDGDIAGPRSGRAAGVTGRLVRRLYDRLCRGGALLACSALSDVTRARPVLCYYGTASPGAPAARWDRAQVTFLMAGTLGPETGADMLVNAIRALRHESPEWASQVCFEVTGKGESIEAYRALAEQPGVPRVTVHGRTTDEEYRRILSRCEVGLALKPVGGPLADTTFPSKVVEFAGAGLLVLTTDISDVRRVLGAGAVYLEDNDPRQLISLIRAVIQDRAASMSIARLGERAVLERCSPRLAGRAVAEFIFGQPA